MCAVLLFQNAAKDYHLLLKVKELVVWFCHTMRVSQYTCKLVAINPWSLSFTHRATGLRWTDSMKYCWR